LTPGQFGFKQSSVEQVAGLWIVVAERKQKRLNQPEQSTILLFVFFDISFFHRFSSFFL